MATVIKKISELEHLEGLTSFSNVIIEENGEAKRFSAASLGKVKTVNGVEPDENGNIEVEIGGSSGGGVSSWNDLTDKPFGEESITLDIHWDGEIGDRSYIQAGDTMYLVHVSDYVLNSADAFIGMTVTAADAVITIDSSQIAVMGEMILLAGSVAIVPYDNFIFETFTFPKAGIYFSKENDSFISSLSGESTIVNKLDDKYTNNPVTLSISYTYNEESGEYTDVVSNYGFSDVNNAFKNGYGVYVSYPVTFNKMNIVDRVPAEVASIEAYGVIQGYYLFYTDIYGKDMGLSYDMNGDIYLEAGHPFKGPSSALPEVTTENNGQILGVTDGTWGAMDAPSGLPEVSTVDNGKVMTVTDGTWAVGEIEIPEVNYPVTSVNGQTGDVRVQGQCQDSQDLQR